MTRNPLVSALVAGLAVLAFWLFVLGPRGAEIDRLNDEVATAQADVDSLNQRLVTLQGVDPGSLQAELAAFRKKIPSTPDESGIIQTLLDAAESASVDGRVAIDGIQFGSPGSIGAAPVSLISLTFTAKGSYFDLARFLFELENLDRLAYVRTISVSPGEGGLALSLAVDVYTTDTSAGPGSDPAPGPEVGA